MIHRDLREWINDLEKNGELLRIKEEINLEPDVGAIGRAVCDFHGPGILAEKIAGYDDAKLSLFLHGTIQRAALALGLPKDADVREQKKAWLKAYKKYPMAPRVVSKQAALCKENIIHGKDVNLFKFPIPRINTDDAAPYITKTLCITKDPESDWVNFGMYRLMVLDRNKTSIMTSHTSHWGEHYTKARRLGKPLEMAIALGTDPVLASVSSFKIPKDWKEYEFAGALRGVPEEIVPAESVELPVPATAEIILEGTLSLETDVFEGPFGEFTGAFSGALMMPSFEVKTITHRNNPIFDSVYVGMGRTHYLATIPKVVALERELKRACASITEVAYLEPTHLNCVVQGKWLNKTEPRRVMNAVWASEANVQSKMVTIVDEDIDPWNAEQVMWAIATRCQANKDIVMIPGAHCRLDPSMEADGTTCEFGIDATKSMEPHPRHIISEWIEPRKETKAWKKKIMQLMKEGGS